jgi:hypothetical protein
MDREGSMTAPIDDALADIRAQRAACLELLRSRPSAEAADIALEETTRLDVLEAWWLDEHGTDPF